MEYLSRTLSAVVQLLLRLFHGKVNPDGTVSFKKTVDLFFIDLSMNFIPCDGLEIHVSKIQSWNTLKRQIIRCQES